MKSLDPLIRSWITLSGALFLTWASPAFAQSAPPGGTASPQVLFAFDDRSLPFQQGVRLQLIGYHSRLSDTHPTNEVLPPGPAGAPDSIGCYYYGNVQKVGDELFMWYLGIGDRDPEPRVTHLHVCFAKSRDGEHWEKPALGLVDYAGSRSNNVVALGNKDFSGIVEFVVLHDPDDPDPSRRFKMAFEDKKRYHQHLAVAYSADGLRWRESPDNPRGPSCEMSGLIKWRGAYYVCAHADGHWVPGGGWARALDDIVSYDFEHWYEVPALGFRRDPLPPRPITAIDDTDGEQVHLGASLWNRGNVIVGFYGQWHGSPTGDRRMVSIDLGLVISHDALHYFEPIPDFRIVAAKENTHSWPAQPIVTPSLAQGEGFVNLGKRTLVWYGLWNQPGEGVRLASWERDRLGYLVPFVDAKARPSVTSAPIDLDGRPVEISLNIAGLSELARPKVSLLDEQFRVLPGFEADQNTAPAASGLRQRAEWGGTSRISYGKPFRVRVDFGGARPEDLRLYAIYAAAQP